MHRLSLAIVITMVASACNDAPRRWITWAGSERVEYIGESGVVLQRHMNDCGPAAIYTLAAALGLSAVSSPNDDGPAQESAVLSMATLRQLAAGHGIVLRGVYDSQRTGESPVPWIAHLNIGEGHFVVVEQAGGLEWTISDPAWGRLRVREDAFRRHWSGHALIVAEVRQIVLQR